MEIKDSIYEPLRRKLEELWTDHEIIVIHKAVEKYQDFPLKKTVAILKHNNRRTNMTGKRKKASLWDFVETQLCKIMIDIKFSHFIIENLHRSGQSQFPIQFVFLNINADKSLKFNRPS